MIDVVETLKDLVRINTTNPPGNEVLILEYLGKIFTEEKIAFTCQMTDENRGNMIAYLPATQSADQPPLILLSHIDVVAAQAEQWSKPPFAAEEENGYIYGRGTVDTKQLTVMELAAFLELKKECGKRNRDVYFIATADEESGSTLGIKWLLEHEITLDGKVRNANDLFQNSDVISEGGGFPIIAGEKEFYLCESGQKSCGTVEFIVKAKNSKGPFLPSGDGMERAMSLVTDIGNTRLEEKTLDTVRNFEEKLKGASLSPMMNKILEAMKHNTMTVTMIQGTNLNEIKVTCDVRLIPGYDRNYLEEILKMFARKWDCEYRIAALGKGYECEPGGVMPAFLEAATLKVLGKSKKEAEILPFVSMGSSDGHYLVDYQANVFGYSPVYSWDMTFDSAVTMVHGINERIHRESVIFGSKVLTIAVKNAVGEETKHD